MAESNSKAARAERRRANPEICRFFEAAYRVQPPWDIGRPQQAFFEIADLRRVSGSVLDVGCGTGENALLLAGRGFEVCGVDLARNALAQARAKAEQRRLGACFVHGDALALDELGRSFDGVIDSGLLHTLAPWERGVFRENLARVLRHNGRYHVLCFSEQEPDGWGPRRIRRDELCELFADGFRLLALREARFETRFGGEGARAWLASFERV